MTSDGTILGRP